MNTDLIIPITLITIVIVIGIVSLIFNVADSLNWFRVWWDNERMKAEQRAVNRARVTPVPLISFPVYVNIPDEQDTDSSGNTVLPGSSAAEPIPELARTDPSSAPEPLDINERNITQLARITLSNIDGTTRQLSYETIAKLAGVSKQTASVFIRKARNIPEPEKIKPYSFDEKGRRID